MTLPDLRGLTRQNVRGVWAASPFLPACYSTRRPYLPTTRETVKQFRRTVEEQFADLIWQG